MLTCALNAAEGQLNIVLGTDDGIVCVQNWSTSAKGPIKGAEILTPALNSLFSITPYKINDVKRWACVHGPGSFTGIRLVLGTVAGIRRITRAQNAGINFLQALALHAKDAKDLKNHCSESSAKQVYVLSHARRNMVHFQVFSLDDSMPKALAPAKLSMLDEVLNDLQNAPENSLLLGSGYIRNKDSLKPQLPKNIQVIEHENPSAKAIWQLAMQAQYHANDIEPLYIRPCDAIENLDYIAKKQGMEPQFAHARLEELLKQSNF